MQTPRTSDPAILPGVSFVVPVRNGAPWLEAVLRAIATQADGRALEIIVVDDGSRDGSREVLERVRRDIPLRILDGSGSGAAAAINTGIRQARFPLIAQVDQDVILEPGWLTSLAAAFDDPAVGAAQGYYIAAPDAGWCARAMALDLRQRYAALRHGRTDHVCTGNSVYRAEAIRAIGLFDERLGYGYDNDVSYRLQRAGWKLVFRRSASAAHRWREGLTAYCRQQYGFGYGRLDVVAKHPARVLGDQVSPAPMMLHAGAMLAVLLLAFLAAVCGIAGWPWIGPAALAFFITLTLLTERTLAGVVAAFTFREPAGLLFPALHLARDLSWAAAIVRWCWRRAALVRTHPAHSMTPRPSSPAPLRPTRVIGIIPAHNESASLAMVVEELRRECPHLPLLIVDDGSTDDTRRLLQTLDARWIRLPERMGVGSAMRAGLRFAARQGFDTAVRIDGDGQHDATEIARLLAPLYAGRADAVLGSRFTAGGPRGFALVRVIQRSLAACLSFITSRTVTDPTSGFWALGPRAVKLLTRHHPSGYPEPELRLLLTCAGLTVTEVPVTERARFGGRTSLTLGRLTAAAARVLLAIFVVPFRRPAGVADVD